MSSASFSKGSSSKLPTVAIIGRPNVGKSTLLNRIVGRRVAITEEHPGVTRDRKIVDAEWGGVPFQVVDTGGWLPGGSDLDEKVSRQSEKAMTDSDVLVFVVDSRTGPTDDDTRVAGLLRRSGKPVLVAVNKIDHTNREVDAWEFVGLGLGDPMAISALHGNGTGDLLDAVLAGFPEPAVRTSPRRPESSDADAEGEEIIGDDPLASLPTLAIDGEEVGEQLFSVAIVGRPNVGKSTLFNRLIGEDRAVVHDMPGTTRDAIDTVVQTDFGPIRFVDTAGMRRRSRIDEATEFFSMVRALKAVDAADVAILVIDATQGITHQDQRLAERVDAAGCPVAVLLNKWELLDAEGRLQISAQAADKLRFLGQAPLLKGSALSGKGIHKLLPSLAEIIDDYHTRVPTSVVNRVIRDAQAAQPAPGGARVLYALQGAVDPPTFTLFANRELPQTYLRYLERRLREDCKLGSTPIRIRVRRRVS